MLASVASQQAAFLAKVFLDPQKNGAAAFHYKDMGTLATIGRNKAVADLGGFKFHGTFAWFLWMSVHLMLPAGFRNRLVTLLDWAWNYISYDRALRLIIRPFKK
jgi:NADH dehydrogenase